MPATKLSGVIPKFFNLDTTILGLSPDYAVVMDGRNEIYPQTYNHYVETYDHYRITDNEELRLQHADLKRLFRISHTALILAVRSSCLATGTRPNVSQRIWPARRWPRGSPRRWTR